MGSESPKGRKRFSDDIGCTSGKRAKQQDLVENVGPSTPEVAFSWPTFKLSQSWSHHKLRTQLLTNLQPGALVTSDFSGMGSEMEILKQIDSALEIAGASWVGQGSRFKHLSSCDYDKLPQKVPCQACTLWLIEMTGVWTD